MDKKHIDFEGWATKNDLKCSDGRIIRQDAFKHCDGLKVPLVWNHDHNEPENVLGHAYLENREGGVYTYGVFNDTPAGQIAKSLVQHGDINALSIYANQLKQRGSDVIHGAIREVSLVIAGANPGAFIQQVLSHSAESGEEAIIYTGEFLSLTHSSDTEEVEEIEEITEEVVETKETEEVIEHAETAKSETIQDVFNGMTEKQKLAVYAIAAQLMEDQIKADGKTTEEVKHSEGGDQEMKQNVFDQQNEITESVLSHADQTAILTLAKKPSVGSLKMAMEQYAEENNVMIHGFEDITELFPDYKDLKPGAPEKITRDLSWVDHVMNKVKKSPISRIRTRQMDVRASDLRALGYTNREIAKKNGGVMTLLKRTTDPQTVYRKDELHRDDIIDITDFDVVSYQYGVMYDNLKEDIALSILIGDGRDDEDEDKIQESHIRSIWNDVELYTIHQDVDLTAAKAELQGTNTGANFGENYVMAEAIITNALYARERYKGSGSLDLYCTPHMLNVMLLARDLNGRRIYNSKADLAAALNVGNIFTVEQFEGKTRVTTAAVDGDAKAGKTKKLLGLFVNLADYQVGSTKGGEITKFDDFDIDFNKYKYLIETRLSGASTKIASAIALEEDVTPASTPDADDETIE